MALNKVTYVDGETVIYAQNLNDIQDEIIQNAEDIEDITVPSPSSEAPEDLGTASSGSSSDYSRADHVHKMPSASDVGAATPSDLYSFLPVDSASGAIASFPDGADSVPVEALSVAIEPVQDLHGQSSPYPAGGGKNKIDPSKFVQRSGYSNLSVSVNKNVMTISGYDAGGRFGCFNVPTVVGQAYTVKLTARNNVTGIRHVESATEPTAWISGGTALGVDAAYTFTAAQPWSQIAVELSANNATVTDLQFESGSTATTFAPYANICPITGWSEAKVTRTGANIWGGEEMVNAFRSCNYPPDFSEDDVNKTFTFTRAVPIGGDYNRVLFAPIEKQRYTLIITYSNAGNNSSLLLQHTDNTTTTVPLENTNGVKKTIAFSSTVNKNLQAVILSYYANNITTVYYEESGLFAGEITADQFAPYTAQTVTIDLSGTRYGGVLDVKTGVLTVTHGIIEATTAASASTSSTGINYASININPAGQLTEKVNSCISDTYEYVTGVPYAGTNNIFRVLNTTLYLYDNRFTNLATAQSILASEKPNFVYLLATPISVQLTANELETLLGQNNVWANCGDVEVSYRADIQLYIEKKLS